jgi:hypothetical protein
METETETHNSSQRIIKRDPPATTAKEELINNIREWIKVDNEIIKLKAETKLLNAKQKGLTDSLVKIMKGNSIDCFDINGGALMYKQKKTKKTISGKFLLTELKKYYKEQPQMAEELTKHLLDNREETVKDGLHRKINK